MPLGRAHVGHRLDRLVLGRQRGGQRLGQAPGGDEPLGQHLVVDGGQEVGHPRSFRFARGSSGAAPADRRGATGRTYPEAVPFMPTADRDPGTGAVAATGDGAPRSSRRWELNPRPDDYKSSALPTELHRPWLRRRSGTRPSVRFRAARRTGVLAIHPAGWQAAGVDDPSAPDAQPPERPGHRVPVDRAVHPARALRRWPPCSCSAASTRHDRRRPRRGHDDDDDRRVGADHATGHGRPDHHHGAQGQPATCRCWWPTPRASPVPRRRSPTSSRWPGWNVQAPDQRHGQRVDLERLLRGRPEGRRQSGGRDPPPARRRWCCPTRRPRR